LAYHHINTSGFVRRGRTAALSANRPARHGSLDSLGDDARWPSPRGTKLMA